MIAVLAALALQAAQPAQAAQPVRPAPTPPPSGTIVDPDEVAGVEVRATRPDQLLTVVVSGDVLEDSTVGSAPLGMTCGGGEFQYDTSLQRQCWLRVRKGANVLLGATSKGLYGRDWSVDWVGCTPVSNGSMCQLAMADDHNVGAVFRRQRR